MINDILNLILALFWQGFEIALAFYIVVWLPLSFVYHFIQSFRDGPAIPSVTTDADITNFARGEAFNMRMANELKWRQMCSPNEK